MYNIRGRNVNHCFQEALLLMKVSGIEMNSRNGKVLMLPEPACITYDIPTECVHFNPKRDANPFFHLMEALWMLRGGRDVAFPAQFNEGIKRYSDDGVNLHGAYGHRWIHHFRFNQLELIAKELQQDRESRRCVLQMWDPAVDWPAVMQGGKDVPCNTEALFSIKPDGRLDLTVFNRSNDLVWGALGANAVHFSFLLQWMAWRINRSVGSYYQITNNLHLYEQHWWMMKDEEALHVYFDTSYASKPHPLAFQSTSHRLFDLELDRFITTTPSDSEYYTVPFLQDVARPMRLAYLYRKNGLGDGLAWIDQMVPCDWKIAGEAWIKRRMKV